MDDPKIFSAFNYARFKCDELAAKISYLAEKTRKQTYAEQLNGDLGILRKRIDAWEKEWRSASPNGNHASGPSQLRNSHAGNQSSPPRLR